MGLLDVDVEGHGALRLTAESAAVLRGERALSFRAEPPKRPRRASADATASTPAVDLPPDALVRFDALRAWRADAARAQNVPAYVIFHDSTLRAIALARPRDLASLARIQGVGDRKLERYGQPLLEMLAAA
jgi:ATP-dependent DNA helicase RecQ